jgi:hypothetical protein
MSAVLLSGLLLNAAAGWWWADPVAGLAIAVIAVKEGRSAWLGKGCCTSKPVELPAQHLGARDSSGSCC